MSLKRSSTKIDNGDKTKETKNGKKRKKDEKMLKSSGFSPRRIRSDAVEIYFR